jgi:hypothetical protein
MTCRMVVKKLPGYLDGALAAGDHALLAGHLVECLDCRRELEAHSRVATLLARVQPAVPPADLSLRIRVAVAQRRAQGTWWQRLRRVAALALHNIFEPFAVPATGGVLMSLAVYAFILQSLLFGVPLGAVPNDQHINVNLIQPARLQTLSPFPLHVSGDSAIEGRSDVRLVEFTVNAEGRAVSYEILSGTADRDTHRLLDQVMLFSSFRPQLSFGRPTGGGRVVVQFDEFRVKG